MNALSDDELSDLDLDIREIKLDDLPKIFALGERLFTAEKWPSLYRTWDEYELVGFFESDGEYSYVAELNGEIVGFALGTIIEKRKNSWIYGYVVWLGVAPELKGKGVGKMLLDTLTELFIKDGARMMLVDTDSENNYAINFFKKNGFSNEVGHVFFSKNLTEHPKYLKKKLNRKVKTSRKRKGKV